MQCLTGQLTCCMQRCRCDNQPHPVIRSVNRALQTRNSLELPRFNLQFACKTHGSQNMYVYIL